MQIGKDGSSMENNKSKFDESELSEFAQKILLGMRRAIRKLVEESAALGKSLVISEDGEVKHVPAKDLLAKLDEDERTRKTQG
jgi:hypothetical protein